MAYPVMFVSLGPGDPELITWKGLKTLQAADVIFCPATQTAHQSIFSRALTILQALDIDAAKVQTFHVPMNKNRAMALAAYSAVSTQIIERCRKGDRVVVTAEGDAGFYSSIHYICTHLWQADVAVERIAGVPAFIAAGALANLHVVKQEEKLLVIPGIADEEMLRMHLKDIQTVVIMKPSQCEAAVKALCSDANHSFHYFENVGVSDKEYYTSDAAAITARAFPYFSLVIIQTQTDV